MLATKSLVSVAPEVNLRNPWVWHTGNEAQEVMGCTPVIKPRTEGTSGRTKRVI